MIERKFKSKENWWEKVKRIKKNNVINEAEWSGEMKESFNKNKKKSDKK